MTVASGLVEGVPQPFDVQESKKLTEDKSAYECDGYTLCELILETGRTHQIRVHMGSLGHFVVGDTLYGGVLCAPDESGMYRPIAARQLLHAYALSFLHPVSGEHLELRAPVPEDLAVLCPGFKDMI